MKTKDVLKHLFKIKPWQKWPKGIKYATLSIIFYLLLALIAYVTISTIQNWNTLMLNAQLHSQGVTDTLPYYPVQPIGKRDGTVTPRNFSILEAKSWEALLLWIFYLPFYLLYELVSGMSKIFNDLATINLAQIFGATSSSGKTLNDFYNLIALICLAFISLLIIFAVLKSWLTYTNNKNVNIVGNLGFKIISALLLLAAMPLLFLALNSLILKIVNALLNFTGSGDFSKQLLSTGYTDNGTEISSNPELGYRWFYGFWATYNWYPFIPFLNGVVLLYVLVMICIALVLRIFNILTLYVISPFPIVSSVSDDYSKLIKWKDLLFAKYLEVCIFIITTGIYFGFMNVVDALIYTPLAKYVWWVKVLGILIVSIAGAMYLLHGQALLCAMLGTNTQLEQAAEHLGGGFRTAGLLVASGAAFGLKALGGGTKLAAGAIGKLHPKSTPTGLTAPLKIRMNNFGARNLKGVAGQIGKNKKTNASNKTVNQATQSGSVNRR